jgi:hypothetical protein
MGDRIADKTTCSDCGCELSELTCVCTKCGSKKKTFHLSVYEKITVREGVGMKVKRLGEKKPYFESLNIPSLFVRINKIVNRIRIIDRENDRYKEVVSQYEDGEIIHECDEKLSDHKGHGSAKKAGKK